MGLTPALSSTAIVLQSLSERGLLKTEAGQRFPHLKILARANGLQHAYQLLDAGADEVFRETMDSALGMGVQALEAVGFRAHQAARAARLFRRHEEETMRELYGLWKDRHAYYDRAGQRISELERLMETDERDFGDTVDHAWEGPPRREG